MRNELQAALHLVETASPAEIPALLGELEQIRITALARLSSPLLQAAHDELLDVSEAARRLGVSEDYLYRHAPEYPFSRRLGRKLLFSAQGIDKYIRQQAGR